MKGTYRLSNTLPPIQRLDLDQIKKPITYIGAVGFEDRSQAVLDDAAKTGWKADQIIAIEYKPVDRRNRRSKFARKLRELKIDPDKQTWIVYDRFDPESFMPAIEAVKGRILGDRVVLIDISGMSKFLIVVLLQLLGDLQVDIEIAYAEAAVYHPKRSEFLTKRRKLPEASPDFLTTDVYTITTATSVSSVAMQGYPMVMIAFPTFNHRELMALLNEMTPQRLVSIEGLPHETKDHWRLDAVRWINRNLGDYSIVESKEVSTFHYVQTIECLEAIYRQYSTSHRIVVAPTGSKFQSLAVFLFKQLHPEIQIVYPVTRKFSNAYTERHKALWRVSFPRFPDFLNRLDNYRKQSLVELKTAIESFEIKTGTQPNIQPA